MKCPNESCGGKVEETVDSSGGGSRYCLDACGYYEEFPPMTKTPPKPYVAPSPKRRRKPDGR